MADRRPIQQAHERTFVEHFLEWFNRTHRCGFHVIEEPNPPEAVISTTRTTRWVEVTTAFWNQAYARDLYSYATPGEEHKPIGKGPCRGMDQEFAKSFVSVLKKKLEKRSYVPWRDRFGPGYLIVPIKHPWFDRMAVQEMKEVWKTSVVTDIGCFRSVYIAFPSLGNIRFYRWPIKSV